jgi:hypothetical protein
MDPLSLATALSASQVGRAQMALAARMLRMNAEAEASIVQVIDAAQRNIASLGNLAAGHRPESQYNGVDPALACGDA